MKEQCIETYDVNSFISLLDMKSDMESHLKRGWIIKTMYKAYSSYTIVVYEREVANQSDENVS